MKRIAQTITGSCRCSALRYAASAVMDNAHLCYCQMCQKAIGNLFAALAAVPREAFAWTRRIPARWRSSAKVDRGFCVSRGTPITIGPAGRSRLRSELRPQSTRSLR